MSEKILLLASILLLSACTDPPRAIEAIENTGLKPISVGGYSFFGCSKDDYWRTNFTAKRPDGKIISGQVCEGIFKGATVRFN